jgi:hypothetical protein
VDLHLIRLAVDVGQREQMSIDHEFEVAVVFRDSANGIDFVAADAELLNEQFYVEHIWQPL